MKKSVAFLYLAWLELISHISFEPLLLRLCQGPA